MKSYKGWEIRGSASLGFFSSGRGGKTVKSYSAYKNIASPFAPRVRAKTLKELKKYIDEYESKANREGGSTSIEIFPKGWFD